MCRLVKYHLRNCLILLTCLVYHFCFPYSSPAQQPPCPGDQKGYACQIADVQQFNRLIVNDQFNRFNLKYRGPFVRALVPKSDRIQAFCNQKAPGQPCLNYPFFSSGDLQDDPKDILDKLYPQIFANMSRRGEWRDIRFNPDKRVYYECILQRLDWQQDGKYGFECLSWNNGERLSQSDITDANQQLIRVFSINPLYYAPDGKLLGREEEVKKWPTPAFSILYEILAMTDITSTQDLLRLTGYNLKEDRLMFIIPRTEDNDGNGVSNIDQFCLPLEKQGAKCLRNVLFSSTVLGNDHAAFLQVLYPDLANFSLAQLISDKNGPYHFGSIWQNPIDQGFFRFDGSRFLDSRPIFTYTEILDMYNQLTAHFSASGVGPLRYDPLEGAQEAAARTWPNPAFPIMFSDQEPNVNYEAYIQGRAFGYIRRFHLDDFIAKGNAGEIDWRDIVVIDEAPFDSEAIFSGAITGTRQPPLSSHFSIRIANRGIPDVYVADAYNVLAPYENKLVELTVGANEYTINPNVTQQEANTFWAEHRPHLQPPTAINKSDRRILNLLEMTDEPTSRFSRYGAKAANLSKLYQNVFNSEENKKYRLRGMAIPFFYFIEFMNDPQNTIYDLTINQRSTYWQYYLNLLNYDPFKNDSKLRHDLFADLISEIQNNGRVKDTTVQTIIAKIQEVFQLNEKGCAIGSACDKASDFSRVRFRSSSNLEDGIEFNGAGLYESYSVCPADNLDDDGPDSESKCFTDGRKERTVERVIKKVWSSIFNPRAFEERNYFQLPQEKANMAIEVNDASDEDSNAVAFTGLPQTPQLNPDIVQYTVNAQAGELSIVSPNPNVRAEVDVVKVSRSTNQVKDILRLQPSSELPQGQFVLSNEQLLEYGKTLLLIDKNFDIDTQEYPAHCVIRDTESKYRSGQLIYKQVRPFLVCSRVNRAFSMQTPEAPTNLKIEKVNDLQVSLSWDNTAQLVDQVLIERKVGADGWQLYDTLGPTSLNYIDKNVQSVTSYQYRVRYENYNGESLPSNIVSITTPVWAPFNRGDVNADGAINITDAIYLLQALFSGGPQPTCQDAADTNDDGGINITDAIYLLQALFSGGPQPPAPFQQCGADLTPDDLTCVAFPADNCL